MQQRIIISNTDNVPTAYFNTGLDPRAFARTKMSQSLIEEGHIVNQDGTHEIWKAAGVSEINGSMSVWGPLFQGKRLDLIIDEINTPDHAKTQTAVKALVCWIKAKMFLGDGKSALNNGAVFISDEDGRVFFAPEHLANRCIYIEGSKLDRNNCPDLIGMEASAFCAALMLYKIFTGLHPYPTAEIYQDMREGIFLPIHLASPNLHEKLSELIKEALLLPVENKKTSKSGTVILGEILAILSGNEQLLKTLPAEKAKRIEKEKKSYLFKQNSYVKTRRFIVRNKFVLIGIGVSIAFLVFILLSSIKGSITTQGLGAEDVVITYYNAFSLLKDDVMRACINGASKRDIEAAGILHAITKQREYYENKTEPVFVTAQAWRNQGGELPSPNAFGVTDLDIETLTKRPDGSRVNDDIVVFRANYSLWSPTEQYEIKRSDVLMLKRDRHKNWRIIEIERTER